MCVEFEIILFILCVMFLGTFPLILFYLDDIVVGIEKFIESIKERMKGE